MVRAQTSTDLAGVFKDDFGEIRQNDQKPAIMCECCEILPILRDSHFLERPNSDPQLLHPVLLHQQHVIPHPEQHLHVPGHRVLRIDHRHAQRILIDPWIREPARHRILEVGDAEDQEPLGDAHHAVPPKDAIHDALLETFFPHGELGGAELGVDVIAVDGAVLDNADEDLIIGPGHADKAAAWAVPDGGGEGATGGVEDEELAAGGLGVELDNLGIVADGRDGAAKGCSGDTVAGEVDAAPLHRVDG